MTNSRYAPGLLEDPRPAREGLEVRASGRSLLLTGARPGDCLTYTVALDRVPDAGSMPVALRTRAGFASDSSLWLWRPVGDGELDVRFELPEGMAVSAPWPLVRPGQAGHYRVRGSQPAWRNMVGFGHLQERDVEVPGGLLRLAVMDSEPGADPDAMADWLGEAGRAVAGLYGRFPRPSTQVLVVPVGARDGPVPWAQVLRGGAPAVHFFVDPTRPLDEFRADWTATHEFSHLLLPYVRRRDAWASEGLASYYQNVLRARAGMLREEEAWEKLYSGFGRGRRDTGDGTLAEAGENRPGNIMRIYWGGAAVWLMADVELRRRSAGRQSLDTALAGLAECCLDEGRIWSARELFRRLDDITGEDVLETLYDRHVTAEAFPNLGPVSEALGIRESLFFGLRFADSPQAAELRAAIMTGAPRLTETLPESRHDPRASAP